VRKANASDAATLAPNLRQADAREIKACSGSTPLQALTHSYQHSLICYTVEDDDGTVIAMFGVAESNRPDVGIVWMLAADRILNHRKQLIRECRTWIDRLHERFPVLWNLVDERNAVHVRWLRWLGCNFVARHEQAGVERIPFLEFIHVCSRPRGDGRSGNRHDRSINCCSGSCR
jgi:hypothetical protein